MAEKINKYLMLSKKHFLSTDKHVVIASDLRKPYTIQTPWYFQGEISPKQIGFTFDDGKAVPIMSSVEPTDVIDFGLWSLRVINRYQDIELSFRGYKMYISTVKTIQAVAGTQSNRRKTTNMLEVKAQASTGWSRDGIKREPDYEYLRPVGLLGQVKMNTGVLNFGMTLSLFTLKYRRIDFGGTCWVFFYGMIALILDDEMGLDAVGVVQRIRTKDEDGVGTLELSDVLWTKNGYIQKAVMTNL